MTIHIYPVLAENFEDFVFFIVITTIFSLCELIVRINSTNKAESTGWDVDVRQYSHNDIVVNPVEGFTKVH